MAGGGGGEVKCLPLLHMITFESVMGEKGSCFVFFVFCILRLSFPISHLNYCTVRKRVPVLSMESSCPYLADVRIKAKGSEPWMLSLSVC